MNNKIQNILSGTVYALSMITEYRDPFTAGHAQRVASLSYAIGKKMKLCQDKLIGLRIAGLLHDLGKSIIPIAILSKPGKLTEAEFAIIKDHPKTGYEILRAIPFDWPIAQICLQHHERCQKNGYPFGLSEKELLQESKILAVADVYDAMVSSRSYRAALPKAMAIDELTENKGILYDPCAVEALLSLLKTNQDLFDL